MTAEAIAKVTNTTNPRLNLATLANDPIWAGWKEEMGKGKRAKLPYDPRTGQLASEHDTGTWATLEEAESWVAMNGGDGVGLMLCQIDNNRLLCGVHLHSCRDPETEAVEPWAQTVIDRLNTYAEASPQGTCVYVFFTVAGSNLPAIEALFRGGYCRVFQRGTDRPSAIKIYRGRHFFAVTWEAITDMEDLRLVDVAELQWLLGEAGPKFAGHSGKGTSEEESRSTQASRAGVLLKAGGATNDDKRIALLAHEDREKADKTSAKSLAAGEHETRRGSDKVGGETATDRPTIWLRVGQTERVVDEIEAALIASGRGLYRRGGLIVSTGFDKMQTLDGDTVEVQIIEERENFALLEDIDATAVLLKLDARAGEWRPTLPTMRLALTLKQRRHNLRLPNLVALVNCPTIMANGELLTEPGFDPSSGILFDPRGVKFPRVPDKPDKAMAQAALEQIDRLIRTFDFVGLDDKAVARSLLLTGVARPCLPTAPLHAVDAPVARSGKSKLIDIISILITGHEAGVTAPGETREEAEKRLATLLLRGDPIIALDNCEAPLEGVVLNQVLTQQWANLRILGFSKAVRTRCAPFITATGNNLIIKGDLAHRSVVCRLDPRVERPELRQFDYDPIADAKSNRGELVAAVLTILRAYHVAGRPDRPPRLQGFGHWSDTVRGALLWLDAGDPVGTMDRLRKADPDLASLTAVLHAWRAAFGVSPTTSREAITAAENRPDLHDAFMAVAGRSGRIDGRALGHWLANRADRVVNLSDGLLPNFVAIEAAGQRQGVALWHLAERK
jgi:hypothetical protein